MRIMSIVLNALQCSMVRGSVRDLGCRAGLGRLGRFGEAGFRLGGGSSVGAHVEAARRRRAGAVRVAVYLSCALPQKN